MSQMRPKKSILWNYFNVIRDTQYAKCSFCSARISFKSTISNLKGHFERKHPKVYSKIFHRIKEEDVTKTKNVYGSDPLFVSEPALPKPLKVNAKAKQSSLNRSTKTSFKKHLERRHQEEHEAFDSSEDTQAIPAIRKVYQPRFALSWDSYQNRLCSNLNTLLKNEDFVDLTLAAGGQLVKVHQLIMSVASPYLREIIHSSPARHPIIFLTNVSYPTLKNLLQYVYTGQVEITEEELEPFFAAAKALQIQGIDTKIDTDILKLQADDRIGDAARLAPEQTETAAEEDTGPDYDDFDESQNLIMLRSATTRRSSSLDTDRSPSKRHHTRVSSETLAEELEPGDLGDVMMDEDMVIVASEDTGAVDPIEFYEVSRIDDPDPVKSPKSPKSPPPKNLNSVSVQTMILNQFKYSLVGTCDGGVRRWRCINHKYGCKARSVTNGNTVVERSRPHNHPVHEKK